MGEPVIVVHLTDNPINCSNDMVLIGPDAEAIRQSLTQKPDAA